MQHRTGPFVGQDEILPDLRPSSARSRPEGMELPLNHHNLSAEEQFLVHAIRIMGVRVAAERLMATHLAD